MRVLIIGCGSIGRRHIKNLVSLLKGRGNLEVDAYRSSNKSLPEGISGLITHEFFAWNDVPFGYDFAIVSNPTSEHLGAVRNAKDKCRAIFLEKPIAVDDQQSQELAEIVEGTTCYIACPLRYTAVLQKAKEIASRERVLSVQAISSSYLPDWRPGQDYRNVYSAKAEQGGGVRLDLIHEWDYLTWLFGFPNTTLSSSGKLSSLEIDSEDYASYIALYDDMVVELHLDYFGRHTTRGMRMLTEQHTYSFDISEGLMTRDGVLAAKWEEHPNDKYLLEMEQFLDVLNGGNNPNDAQRASKVVSLCLA